MTESLAGTTEVCRFNLALPGTFTGLALVLSSIGVFAVTAFGVSQRAREFAIRAAVGAHPHQVVIEALRYSLVALLGGCALGLAASAPLMTTLRHFLYSVEPLDWTAYAGAAVFHFFGGAVALVSAARRAVRVNPARALRHD